MEEDFSMRRVTPRASTVGRFLEREPLDPIKEAKTMSAAETHQKLREHLAKAEFRLEFMRDPEVALDNAGIDRSELPPKSIHLLASLSDQELKTLAEVATRSKAFDLIGVVFF
jgi:hypothetical protein